MKKLAQKLKLVFRLSLVLLLFSILTFFILNFIFPLKVNIHYSTIVTDEEGTLLHAFLSKDEKWRFKTELDEITPDLQKAIIFKEDKYFFYHFGINPIAIFRAIFKNTFTGKRTSGASTISMQVVRLLEPSERTYLIKIYEIFKALQLELKYSKKEILQMYLNLVPYGGNIEGVKTASWLYFAKMPQKLSLAQITALSIVPNRPTSLALGKKNEALQKERNRWLENFKEIFPLQVVQDAIAEPLTTRDWQTQKHLRVMIPHLAQRLKRENPEKTLIQTTIEPEKQAKIENLVNAYMQNLQRYDVHNAAVLVIDNRTNKVVAYIGSSDFADKEFAGQVDGILANRSPGSSLKPLVYALGMERGIITPKRKIIDAFLDIDGYSPENFDARYHGAITAESALAYSLNIPAVKLLQEVGLNNMLAVLKKCNFKHISQNQRNIGLSLALGGCGVTLEEMTNLYAMFARQGIYQKANYIKNDTLTWKKEKVFSKEAIYMVAEMLTKVERPELPSDFHHSRNVPKIAWKTGTSYGRRDAWSIGFNNHYTIGVWVGNFSGKPVFQITGAQAATPLLFKLFNTLDYNSTNEWLKYPENMGTRQVCSESGLPPFEFCTNLVSDFFIPLISSAKKCEHLKYVFVSADEQMSYCATCMPQAGYIKKLYPNLPPDLVSYYEEYGHPYAKIPIHNPECSFFADNEQAPKITAPVDGRTYFVDDESTLIQLACKVSNESGKVHWFVNDRFLRTCETAEKPFFKSPKGSVKISCADEKGRSSDIWITVN